MSTDTLLVRKDDLHASRLHSAADQPLADGQVRVRIERFALTANNITYAAFGSAMHYWDFFPSGEADWGIIPVWGFATVSHSLHPGVAVGERLYGFFPMASAAVLTPERLSASGFSDGAPHRSTLPAVYNQLLRCRSDPLHTPETEDLQALLRPLFLTSWLIDDFLDEQDFFGARPGIALLSSASSKTAFGTAFQLAQRKDVEVVGLSSAAHVGFCERLGCYNRVLRYEDLAQLPADAPCVYIDFAGNGELRRAVHTRFSNLKHSASIGGTHVDQLAASGAGKSLPGPRATLFFAPARARQRIADWGGAVFGERMAQAWGAFIARVADPQTPWLKVQRHAGPAAVQSAYEEVLAGRGDPGVGHVLAFQGEPGGAPQGSA